MKPEKVLLFLQKKKQKNSCLLEVVAPSLPHPPESKSFLLLFFKKEVLPYFTSPSPVRNVVIRNKAIPNS